MIVSVPTRVAPVPLPSRRSSPAPLMPISRRMAKSPETEPAALKLLMGLPSGFQCWSERSLGVSFQSWPARRARERAEDGSAAAGRGPGTGPDDESVVGGNGEYQRRDRAKYQPPIPKAPPSPDIS